MKLDSILAIVTLLSAGGIAVPTASYSDHGQLFLPAYSGPVECDKTATNPCPDSSELCCPEERTCVRFAGGQFLCFKTRLSGEDREAMGVRRD